ncbi:MAG: hypothetical protein ABSC35_09150 [Candidatus Dormibacteria bacterium]
MTLSTRALKVMSGVGAVVVCAVSGVLVAIDPKPATAPLRPPIGEPSPASSLLVIPQSCGGATLDPALLPVVEQLRAARSAAARRLILAPLSASQRLDVEAYVRSLARNASDTTGHCDETAGQGGTISPSVVDAPPSTQPLINTYVS